MEDKNKINLTEISWEGVDWIHLVHYNEQCRATVNMIMKFGFRPKVGEFLYKLSDYQILKKGCASIRRNTDTTIISLVKTLKISPCKCRTRNKSFRIRPTLLVRLKTHPYVTMAIYKRKKWNYIITESEYSVESSNIKLVVFVFLERLYLKPTPERILCRRAYLNQLH